MSYKPTSIILFFVLVFSNNAKSNTASNDLPNVGSLSEKELLIAELRTLKKIYGDDKKPQNKTVNTDNNGVIPKIEHPEFGIDDLYPDTPAPRLDEKTVRAIYKTKNWLNKTNTPIVQKGKLIHPYGEGIPTLVLEPLALSNIELSPDETIVPKGLQLGDAVNWGVEETYIGSAESKRPNLIVKSKSIDEMRTILIVLTTKRVYHIQLISTTGQWTPQLSFSYPETSIIRSPETIARLLEEESKKEKETKDSYLYAAGDVDFNYSLDGDKKIMPTRVFNLGHQTVIEMPDFVDMVNVPALLLEDSEGNKEMVNYRFKDHRYIIDQPIYKAYLVSGVGWDQQKVTIRKSLEVIK